MVAEEDTIYHTYIYIYVSVCIEAIWLGVVSGSMTQSQPELLSTAAGPRAGRAWPTSRPPRNGGSCHAFRVASAWRASGSS